MARRSPGTKEYSRMPASARASDTIIKNAAESRRLAEILGDEGSAAVARVAGRMTAKDANADTVKRLTKSQKYR